MDYIGEHLLPGRLGHFFIVLSLVASALATASYFLATRSRQATDATNWRKLARYAFITEVISVFAIFGLLLYIIYNHLFEYKYAWQHSSLSLEFKYLLASLWEGQEGSFLLWSLWHSVLGLILIKTSKSWEAPVMTIVSFAQFCLATMIAGFYIFGWKLGSNPFLLLRDSGVLDNAPALHLDFNVDNPLKPDYLSFIKDGNDLNPLLQNRWMVIHPPVLFLGFASTIVPFAFAVAGLWTKRIGDWTKDALPWSLFATAVLGVGIMMGAWWAYESLTFGGYWAWDPVENASLVPWLILVAGLHTLLIYRHSSHSLRSSYLFLILSFVFVLYSTFLTRSGILGDASVHAFTDLGMNIQLYMFIYLFIWGAALLGAEGRKEILFTAISGTTLAFLSLLLNVPEITFLALLAGVAFLVYQIMSKVPTIEKEENTYSREFWMFIGSLVFFLSALLIIGMTSLPVINKVFDVKIAAPEDTEFSYNRIQVFVAIIIAILTAVTQYFKYKNTPPAYFWKKLLTPTLISFGLVTLAILFLDIDYEKKGPGFKAALWLGLIASIYTVVANASYIWIGLNGRFKNAGGSVAHVGFGMVLVGILISSSNKEMLSRNTSGIFVDFGKESEEKSGENLTLVKGIKTDMGKYWVTYISDSSHPRKQQWYYNIHFQEKNGKEDFILQPNAFVNYKGNEGLMANPDSRHYWSHDIFTYVTSLPDPTKRSLDTTSFKNKMLSPGDSLFYSNGFMILEEVSSTDSVPEDLFGKGGKLYEARLRIFSKTGSIYNLDARLAFAKGEYLGIPDTVKAENLILRLQQVLPGDKIELGVKESDAVMDYVTLKAYKFPMINILWLGIGITAFGIFLSMFKRIRQLSQRSVSPEA